jgi:hypothetical protein
MDAPEGRLLDNLVGAGEQRRRHLEAKRPCGLEVDHELELGRLHDRQVGGLGAVENAADVNTHLAVGIGELRSVAHQAAGRGELPPLVDRGNCVSRCQRDELLTVSGEQDIGANDQRFDPLLNERCERRRKLAFSILGRALKPEEVAYVSEMVRRIAAILLLSPALDANYEAAKANASQPLRW